MKTEILGSNVMTNKTCVVAATVYTRTFSKIVYIGPYLIS